MLVSPAVEVDADARPTLAVPGAVGVPGEQTVWLRLIAAAVGQGQLENLRAGADVQVLLTGGRKGGEEREGDKEQVQSSNPGGGKQRAMSNKREDKQKERGRATQLGGLEEIMG